MQVYDSDGIGLKGCLLLSVKNDIRIKIVPDYAAAYAGGSIIGISENTNPYSDGTLVLGIYKMNVFSRPEQIIQPSVLPGSCFAFR